MTQNVSVAAIVNAHAGGDPWEKVAILRDQPNILLREIVTRSAGDAEAIAHELAGRGEVEVIVAVGGDGTAGEVARGMYRAAGQAGGARPRLLIAPGGTGNSNYRCLWNDEPWAEVVRQVFGGGVAVEKSIDMVHIVELDQRALLGISAGLLPEALTISHSLGSDGREKLAEAAMMALSSYRGYAARVLVDGELFVETEILAVLIGGSRYRGGFLELLPRSILDDGLFDICVVSDRISREEFVTSCLGGALDTAPGSHYGTGKSVRIERMDGEPMKIDYDGELGAVEATAFEFEIVPAAVDVLASPTTGIWSEQRIESTRA